MTAHERQRRTNEADALCAEAYAQAGCPETGVALVAVGGYGRAELAPHSDLDVVLVHEIEPDEWAGQIWYPLWDSGKKIDHSVRTPEQVLEQASSDLRVALGMLDLRHVAGDPNVTLKLRTAVLAQWRHDARSRLRELHDLFIERGERMGELAHDSIPDLKESAGGLRDAVVLKGLVASWLVDVSHVELESCRNTLLDVRDALHEVAGRATDRILHEHWSQIAEQMGLEDAQAVQVLTRKQARRMTHLSRVAWGRAEAVLRKGRGQKRQPRLTLLAPGVAQAHDEEVVLSSEAKPASDPLLLLRAASEAAQRGLVLAPATASRLAKVAPDLPDPWPEEARDLLVKLLAAGPGLLPVWETLDETGGLARILPEWDRVRLLPHASVVHRFTVDRHMVESAIEASALLRRVERPDVLMVATILHDIGKGDMLDHSIVGTPIAEKIARRMGFAEEDVKLIGSLVRWHLLLPETATTRDPDDPATVAMITDRVGSREELKLLVTLTEADARATSEKAWTSWRASLIQTLAGRAKAAMEKRVYAGGLQPAEIDVPERLKGDPEAVEVEVLDDPQDPDGCLVRVYSADRFGALADAAAMLTLSRAPIRAARAWTQGDWAVSQWDVDDPGLNAAVLRRRLEQILVGSIDVAERLRPQGRKAHIAAPSVVVRPEASESATVLEVRSVDHAGLVYRVAAALNALGCAVRSAHAATLGAQAVDVFYVVDRGGAPLDPTRSAEVVSSVSRALSPHPS